MRRHFPIIIEQDSDGVFIVECPSFRGCRSYGDTIEQAMDNIREAIEACLEESPLAKDVTFIGVRDLEVNVA
ncbi:MAG: type II toxin-antitoxin system HicB family antitoxin [Syntrophobacteraceae bacterium]